MTERRTVIRNSLNLAAAVGTYGVAFGAAAVAAGFSVTQASVFSLLTFTGGSQFAVVGVIHGGGTVIAALSSGWLLGARNLLYGLRLHPVLATKGWKTVVAAHGTIDESTAMSVTQIDPAHKRTAFWWTAGGVFVFWNLATVVGAIGAEALGDPKRFGLDAAIPAAFLALVGPWLRAGGRQRLVAMGGALIAGVLIPIAPPGVPVIASLGALAVLADVRMLRRS